MLNHLKKHPVEFAQLKQGVEVTALASIFTSFQRAFSQDKFMVSFMQLFLKQDESVMMTESNEFVAMVQSLNPRATMFSADTLRRRIIDPVAVEQMAFKTRMSQVDSTVSFTTNTWTAPNQVPFLAVTAHYIDNDWKLHDTTLDFNPMRGSHTGSLIADSFYKKCDKYSFSASMVESHWATLPITTRSSRLTLREPASGTPRTYASVVSRTS